jgi:hypothetical protein
MNQLIQLKKDAQDNMDIMQQKFGEYEHQVNNVSTQFLKKLETTVNQALDQWQQEADDFVYFTNFRMKSLLYNWQARLKFMQNSLQDRIGWTYDLVQANVQQVNSFYQGLVDIIHSIQRRYMGDMLVANNMQALMDTLIQILIGFGHVTERYYTMEALATKVNYQPFLGVPGYAPRPLDILSPVGEMLLNDTYRIVMACSQCPNCTDSTLQNYDCRPYYRVGECPAAYVDCQKSSSEGSVVINGTTLVLFRPMNNSYTGTLTYQESGSSSNAKKQRKRRGDNNSTLSQQLSATSDTLTIQSNLLNNTNTTLPPSSSSSMNADDDVEDDSSQNVITFKGTQQLMLILQAKINNYIGLMQTFFGLEPIYWQSTLPEGLIVTEEPSNIFGGEESIKCKEILFGAIREDLVPMVPVRSMRLIQTKYVNNSLIEDDGGTKTSYKFHSAYYEDPYEFHLPAGEQHFIQHRFNNSDIDIVIAPPFEYVNLNPNPVSRMGSATYLFNHSADFSFENNTLPNYDPYGFAVSPSMFIAAYDSKQPWCGSANIDIEDDDSPAIGALKTRYGSNLCTLSDYYDIDERDIDNDGNSIISIRAKSDAIIRYVFKLQINLNYSDINWVCPSLLSDSLLECAGEVCLMNLYNGIMAPTVFQVDVDAGCDKRTMSLSLAAGSTGNFHIQLCPGKPYNVTVYTKNVGTNDVQEVCFSKQGFIETQYYGEIQDHVASAIQKLNITYRRVVFNEYQERSRDQVISRSNELQQRLDHLKMNTSNYTVDDLVNEFNFTVDNAMLDKFLRTQAVYKSLQSSNDIKAKFTNYSTFFDRVSKELQDQIDKETKQKDEFEKQFQQLLNSFTNISSGQGGTSFAIKWVFLGVICAILLFGVVMYFCRRHMAKRQTEEPKDKSSYSKTQFPEKYRKPSHTNLKKKKRKSVPDNDIPMEQPVDWNTNSWPSTESDETESSYQNSSENQSTKPPPYSGANNRFFGERSEIFHRLEGSKTETSLSSERHSSRAIVFKKSGSHVRSPYHDDESQSKNKYQ